MTDKTIPADKVREILDEWERIKEYADWDDLDTLVKDIRALLPTPPTLADMTDEERAACQWMQADVEGQEPSAVIIYPDRGSELVKLLDRWGKMIYAGSNRVTPRPDLPRMEWPGNKKPAPTPALPEGWRLADHEDHGRGIVTNPTPNRDGRVYFVIPADDPMGYDWLFCPADDLTYIDQEAVDAAD